VGVQSPYGATLGRASGSTTTGSKLGHRPALDGVRALAIAAVLLHHAIGFPSGAFLGVDLFFVLSGFLITTLLIEEHREAGAVSLRGFYERRARRLLPALFVVLGVFLAGSTVAALIHEESAGGAIVGVLAGIGYFSNLLLAAETNAMPRELEHLWSLAIEEQFYLAWPLVFVVLLAVRLRAALVVLGVAIVVTTAQQLRLVLEDASWLRIAYGTDTRSTSILVGCLLAVALATRHRQRIERIARTAWPVPVGVLVLMLFASSPHTRLFAGGLLLAAIGMATVILLALDARSRLARALGIRPLVFLGGISYALYLWHVPIFVALGLDQRPELLDVVAVPLAVACAVASHYLVERRFVRRRRGSELAQAALRTSTARPKAPLVAEA
jgi:peptidoglycan/LPS O-acetylase OafA/YrhL